MQNQLVSNLIGKPGAHDYNAGRRNIYLGKDCSGAIEVEVGGSSSRLQRGPGVSRDSVQAVSPEIFLTYVEV